MWGKGAIAFAMWQGSEAWELAHICLTQLTHNYEVVTPFHTTHNHTNTKNYEAVAPFHTTHNRTNTKKG